MDHKRIVKLQCGGSITISGNFDLFDMASNTRDRQLITDLVNILDSYEKENTGELLSISSINDLPQQETR